VVWGKGDYKKCFDPAVRRKNPFRPAGGQKEKGDILCQVFLKICLVAL
jgi:hypothetical protein